MSKSPHQQKSVTITHVISGDLWAGAEVQVYHLCRALNATPGMNVTAVLFNPGLLYEKLIELGIPTTLANEQEFGAVRIAGIIARHCQKNSTDIVHTHGFKENILGVIGKELARVPCSVRTAHGNPEHGFTFRRPHKWLINRLDIWLGRLRQQAVIAVSSQLEQALKPTFPGKVRKIFNFVDVEEIQSTWPHEIKNSQKHEIVLGIVGRLVPVKRVDIFIEAVALLKEQGYDCRGAIIGDGPLKAQLTNLAFKLGISDQISFKGFVNPALEEIRNLDALVMPSDHEGLPMTLLEAVALGIPVVAHNVGGIPEVVKDWKLAALVDQQTPSAYAEKILTVLPYLARPDEAQAVTHPPHFLTDFGSKENARKYVDLYTQILSSPRRANLPTASS